MYQYDGLVRKGIDCLAGEDSQWETVPAEDTWYTLLD